MRVEITHIEGADIDFEKVINNFYDHWKEYLHDLDIREDEATDFDRQDFLYEVWENIGDEIVYGEWATNKFVDDEIHVMR